MGDDARIDGGRRAVWIAFAEHFLDTETRQDLVDAALRAVEAGYSIKEAGRIWRYEVTPAVRLNLWDPVGVWAGFDDTWLVSRIETLRGRWPYRLGVVSYLLYRLTVLFNHRAWVLIKRCMRALLAVEPAARRALANDLHALAEYFYDFVPPDLRLEEPGRRDHLRGVYENVFLPTFGCDWLGTSRAKVERALGYGES